jgi:hypothetical protein
MTKTLIYIGIGLLSIAVLIGIWMFLPKTSQQTPYTNTVGLPTDTNETIPSSATTSGINQPINTSSQTAAVKNIFQITASPVVGATLIQTLHPTTTIARYIKQEDGHVFDLPLDVAGAVPRIVSNVTIPGGQRAVWVEGGNAIMQYIDGNTTKTMYLGFPTATSTTSTLSTRIAFLPDNIVDIAASPDGKSVVYMLKTSFGVDGYIAKPDGTDRKKLFTLPLSQMLISWPSPNTMLAQTKSAAGVTGIAFSIDAKRGVITTLVSADGLTATADRSFAHVIYQTDSSGALMTFSHDIKTGQETRLLLDPIPQKCIWGLQATDTMYCANPVAYVEPSYVDQWNLGASSAADALLAFNISNGSHRTIAIPQASDILEMSVSPDEKYLSFVNKGSRTLWGVRLAQ